MKRTYLAGMALLFSMGLPTAQAADTLPQGTDSFAAAPAITTANGISNQFSLAGFSKEAGEVTHRPFGGIPGMHSAWWSWTAPESGFCTVDTRRTSGLSNGLLDTSIAVYTGAAVNALTRVAINDDYSSSLMNGDRLLSETTFYAVAGTTYKIVVDAYSAEDVTASRFTVQLQVRLVPFRKMSRSNAFVLYDQNLEKIDMGSLSLTTTGTGRFTAKLVTLNKTYSFAGAFGVNGLFSISFEPSFKNGQPQGLPITLTMDIAGEGRFELNMTGLRVDDPLPERAVFTKQAPAGTRGRFNARLGSSGGYLTASISPQGVVKAAGVAQDGTAFSFSTTLHKTLSPQAFDINAAVPMYAKKGGFSIFASVYEQGAKDALSGDAGFYRPAAPGATYYPEGFFTDGGIMGSTYTPPANGARALGFLDFSNGSGVMRVVNENGELPNGNFNEDVTLSTANKFTFASLTRKPSLKLNAKTGLITGSITEPAGKKRSIKGILHDAGVGPTVIGHISGTKNTVSYTIVTP